MRVISIAKRSIGFVICGDIKIHDFIECVEDSGKYYTLKRIGGSSEIIVSKENWRLEIE